jgi:glycosyltransferase involved in cell wall biosynthesis
MREGPVKVSIVLPTYNGAKYLQQSIDSCLNQTYKNIELIIVDDGSMDETSDIIKSYQDEKIKYIRHKKNKGLSHALNTGFKRATGEYLTWTSDDNYYAQNAVGSMVALLQANRKIDFVYANYYIIDDDSEVWQTESVGPSKALKDYNCIGPCFLYRRKIYEVLGEFNSAAFLAEDYEYWIRVFKRFRMQKLDEFIYWHRLHPQSLTGKYAIEAKRWADRIRDNYFKIHAMKRRLSIFLSLGIGMIKRLLRPFYRYLQKSAKIARFRIKEIILNLKK